MRRPVPDWLDQETAVPWSRLETLGLEEADAGITLDTAQASDPDLLAFYLPFHFYRRWGIYFRASGILWLARRLRGGAGPTSDSDARLAAAILHAHEEMHFLAELACSRAELLLHDVLTLKGPSYAPYFQDRNAALLEEALSNAQAFRSTRGSSSRLLANRIRRWMLAQGPGYRDFEQCLTPQRWVRSVRQLLAVMRRHVELKGLVLTPSRISGGGGFRTHASTVPPPVPLPLEILFKATAGDRAAIPRYLVLDTPSLSVLRRLPKYAGIRVTVHSNDHPPPHIHVEHPPGKLATKLEWPTLTPLKGCESPSRQLRKQLQAYLEIYWPKVDARVAAVYGS
jgi:hypothetical protein